MAAAKKDETKQASVAWEDRKVRVRLFKDNERYKDDVTVVANGKAFKIKRGVEVEIPYYVWLVLRASMAQDNDTANLIQAEEEAFKNRESNFAV